jgi:thioesterase domain-containing protein
MSYEPKPYQGRITCFLRDEFYNNRRKGIGDWSDIAVGGLDVRFVPGNIFTMWKEPHVQVLAEQLQVCLDEALMDIGAQGKQSTPTDAADAEMGQNALATPGVSNQ